METNCLRLRQNSTTGNTQLLQMGVSNVGVGGINNGYGDISSVYWGGSENIFDKGPASNQFYFALNGDNLQQAFIGQPANISNRLDFGTGAANIVMTVLGDNVGIGTTNPQAKLAVNGIILATKVKVALTGCWSDYVFNIGYPLRPLSEVEQFINQNHHLPEVPSVQEVEKNGLDVGDNQATLLKKIEELTLYVIEQNKKLESQQQQIDAMRKELNNKRNGRQEAISS